MDARRLNDVLKVIGSFAAALVTLVPFLTGRAQAIVAGIAAAGGFIAGFGTRAVGTEYQSIADAKAIAKVSLMPPPLIAAALAIPSRPPPPPIEVL